MAADDPRLARLALSLLTEPGDPGVASRVRQLGPVDVLSAVGGESATALARAERLLESAQLAGHRWVCRGDPEWPTQLEDLDEVGALQRRGGAPLGLWLRGARALNDVSQRAAAVVGSRAATTYGTQVAADLAADIADGGICVVSGAAYGIDSAAHRGAIAMGGSTVAVLACGVDVAYPRGHESLLARIADEGLVVSELPMRATPTRLRFLSRNRLIAALATGTVVVEAALRSGALNTANWATGLGRAVMGVPGPVTSSMSQGVHRLIRDGGAQLVTCGADVAESIAPLGTDTRGWEEGERRRVDDLSDAEFAVLETLRIHLTTSVSEVAIQAGVDVETTGAVLRRLADAGIAERIGDGWRLAPTAPAVLRAR